MASFRDAQGREWVIKIDLGAMLDVQDRTGLDLPQLMRSDDNIARVIFGDVTATARALWVLCDKQAKELGLSEREFMRLFDGPTLQEATKALLVSVANFSPRSRIGAAMATTTTEILDAMDREAIARLSLMKAEILGRELATNSPESSE